jgi:hypothetical protein
MSKRTKIEYNVSAIYTHLTAISEARTQAALSAFYQPLKP